MKPILALFLVLFCAIGHAQTKVTWGDELKMYTTSTDLGVIYVDQSGEYLQESHPKGGAISESHTSALLVKLSPALSEVYRKNFDAELRGKDFVQFFVVQGKLFLLAKDYSEREKERTLYGAEVDKNTGQLRTELQSIHTWKEGDSDYTSFKLSPRADSTGGVILAATIAGRGKNQYELQVLDANLKPVGASLTITNEFEPKTFQIEDFVYTRSENAVVVGRIYAYEEGKRKRDKTLIFKNYSIRIYDMKGNLVKELTTDSDDKYFVTGKVMQVKNELILAAFYSKDRKKKDISGMIVQRIDPGTGNVLVSTQKDLSASSFKQTDNEETDKRASKKEGSDEEALGAYLRFNKFYLTPDNGVIILAERFHIYFAGFADANGQTSSTFENFDCGDIFMSKVSAQGNLEWIHELPKKQFEATSAGGGGGFLYEEGEDYFQDQIGCPFFAGFGSVEGKNQLHLFFNDIDDNAAVLEPG